MFSITEDAEIYVAELLSSRMKKTWA